MEYPTLMHESDSINYTKIAFSSIRRIPNSIKQSLKHSGRWDDILAEVFVAALESYNLRHTSNQTYNNAKKKIYAALKSQGFRLARMKDRNSVSWVLKELTYGIGEDLEALSKTGKHVIV